MTVEQLRTHLYRLEHDERLTQSEREYVRVKTLGVLVPRPRNVGEAKRYIAALEHALAQATSEIPF